MTYMPFKLNLNPIEIIISFVFVAFDLKESTLVVIAVILVMIPSQVWLSSYIANAIKSYLTSNEERNKMTNETL